MARLLWGLSLAIWLTGCASGLAETTPEATPRLSTWSRPLALAETTLTGAPALNMTSNGWALAWAAEDTVRFAIIQPDGTPGPARTAILGRAPWNLTLLPVPGGEWHLLWQDTDWLGEVRLYSALLASDGTLSRGPLTLAPDPITVYTAAVGTDGTAAVVWADDSARPQLFGRAIDAAGRPTATGPQAIASAASHPALAAVDGGGWLLTWLQRPSSPHAPDTLWNSMALASAAALPWDGPAQPQAIGSVVLDGPTEYVEQLALGLDATTGYVSATVRHAGTGASAVVWLAFDRATLTPLPARKPLIIPANTPANAAPLTTDFHTMVLAAAPDDSTLSASWALPADSQRASLPVALNVAGRLHIAYFRQGTLIGLEALDLDTGGMAWPALCANSAGDLSLMWVVPAGDAASPGRVWMITTRPVNSEE